MDATDERYTSEHVACRLREKSTEFTCEYIYFGITIYSWNHYFELTIRGVVRTLCETTFRNVTGSSPPMTSFPLIPVAKTRCSKLGNSSLNWSSRLSHSTCNVESDRVIDTIELTLWKAWILFSGRYPLLDVISVCSHSSVSTVLLIYSNPIPWIVHYKVTNLARMTKISTSEYSN